MPDSSILDELPHLYDEDVGILYDIVSLAQQSDELPFKALFDAREIVLAQHGAGVEHNSKYLRFLLHVGDALTSAGTQGLVNRYREVLSDLGIQLVLGDGEDNIDEVARPDATNGIYDGHADIGDREERQGRRTRRASFNDSNLDTTWISGDRPLGRETKGRVPGPLRGSSRDQHQRLKLRPSHREDNQRSATAAHAPHGRGRLGNERARSTSTQGSVRRKLDQFNHAHAHHATRPVANGYLSEQEMEDSSRSLSVPQVVSHLSASQQNPYRPTDPRVVSDAEDLYFGRTARHCFHAWHDHAVRNQQARQHLGQIALDHDRRILLKQSLGQMRDSLSEKRFWKQQERRASRARDLFLLTKAFTHWAQTTSDEVLRTSVAQRHILRTRYFNAWRDITVVNELKCRRLGLRKWFSVWRTRSNKQAINDEMGTALFEEKLVEQAYWKWFWAFCERRAPVWKDARLKGHFFAELVALRESRRTQDLAAQRISHQSAQRHASKALVEHWHSRQERESSAINFRRRHLLATAFSTLHIKSRLRLPERQLSATIDLRLVDRAVFVWRLRAQLIRQAVSVDHQRLLRNAWTGWNDQLRVQTLSAKVDDRVVVQALYRWVLEERLALFRRVMEYRSKTRTLEVLSRQLSELRFRLDEAFALFQQGERTRLLRLAMLKLHAKSRSIERNEQSAIEMRNARVIRQSLDSWKEKTVHSRQLNQWARDARFYCLTTSTLKRWKEATTNAKRVRRREAYASVRRNVKVSIARRCMQTWRQKSTRITQLGTLAEQQYMTHLQSVGFTAFEAWRDRAQTCLEQYVQANAKSTQGLILLAMSQMLATTRRTQLQRTRAAVQAAEGIDRSASKMLKKLGDSLFLLRRRDDTALAWRARKFGQHRRNMLRYWAYQAAERRALQGVGDPESPSRRERSLFSSLQLPSAMAPRPDLSRDERTGNEAVDAEDFIHFGATRRAEDWTSFDILGGQLPIVEEDPLQEPQQFATPMPGYLRTPSKRTARAKARFKAISEQASTGRAPQAAAAGFGSSFLSNTTPAPLTAGAVDGMEALTPQVTPFGRKLRAGGYQESTTPATANSRFGQSRFGRSLGGLGDTGRTVRFGDVRAADGGDLGAGFGYGEAYTPAPHEKSS